MRAIRVAPAVLPAVAALALTAPAAQAAVAGDITSFGFGVTPSVVAAGGQVVLRVDHCDTDARVSSGVFDTVTIRKGHSQATARVDWDARPGAVYEVTFRCGHETGRTSLTIASGRPTDHPTRPPVDRGVHAGSGGSADGFDPARIGLGAALIAGALGAAHHWSRRRSAQDPS
jgi:hypothetical protein